MNNKYYDKLNSLGLLENKEKNKLYYELVKFYKHYLEKYIDNKLDLSTIENKFLNDINYLIKPSEEFLKKYKVSSMWNIFYINNEIYLERLDDEELSYLIKVYESKKIDGEFYEFIKRSYGKITKYIEDCPDDYYIHYPNTYEDKYVLNNSIFLLIIVDIFQNEIDNFKEFYFDIIKKLDKLQDEVKEKVLDVPLEVTYMFN